MIIRVNNTVIESEALEEATEAVGHAATWTGEKLMDFGKKQPVRYKIVCNREEVCEKHVVGTEKVTKKVAPPGEWTEEEVEQDIIEWKCNPLLAVVDGE